jgi:hypothetical protein
LNQGYSDLEPQRRLLREVGERVEHRRYAVSAELPIEAVSEGQKFDPNGVSGNFIEPVRPGRVVATASIQRIGGSIAYSSMALGDFDGEILATSHNAHRLFRAARAADPRRKRSLRP